MKGQHSPGPWRVGELESSIVLGADHAAICSCFFFKQRGAPQGETEANARLIASAPELLAACEAMLLRVVQYLERGGALTEGETATVQQMRNAVQQAKGAQPQ